MFVCAKKPGRTGLLCKLLVDRRIRVHQQRRDVLDLLFGQDAVMAESRHVRAGGIRFRIVDLAKCVFLRCLGIATQLGEVVQAGPNIAEGNFLFRQLVAGIAIGTDWTGGVIAELFTDTGLRNFLAFFPITEKLAVCGSP